MSLLLLPLTRLTNSIVLFLRRCLYFLGPASKTAPYFPCLCLKNYPIISLCPCLYTFFYVPQKWPRILVPLPTHFPLPVSQTSQHSPCAPSPLYPHCSSLANSPVLFLCPYLCIFCARSSSLAMPWLLFVCSCLYCHYAPACLPQCFFLFRHSARVCPFTASLLVLSLLLPQSHSDTLPALLPVLPQ